MLAKLRFLSFEVGRECDLAAQHPYCPVNRPERHSASAGLPPLPDAAIIEFVSCARAMGFSGLVAFHYYNEPLLSRDRLDALIAMILAAAPGTGFSLWSNGQRLAPGDAAWLNKFAAVHITAHNRDRQQFYNALQIALPGKVKIMPGGHDDRGSVYDVALKLFPSPCWRPTVTEMIIDYFGELHLCCVDWKAAEKIANLQTDPAGEAIRKWVDAAAAAREGRPEVCRRCRNLRRSPFVAGEDYRL